METAKLFMNGKSQAVRLPKNCRLEGEEVYVKKIGNIVILISKKDPWRSLARSLDRFTPDYMESRDQPVVQKRPEIK
jgi:antitoxin VapB